jgi:MFS family permease
MADLIKKRGTAIILFSLIMALLLAFVGDLAGMYLWSHYGTRANRFDDAGVYLCGLLVAGVFAIVGGTLLLLLLWPREAPKTSPISEPRKQDID